MRILLACNAGMSTSMLVKKMEDAAKAKGIDVEVEAMPITQAERYMNEWDVVMLGPQVRHQLKRLESLSENTPIEVINMRDYGLMNGEKVLEAALALLK